MQTFCPLFKTLRRWDINGVFYVVYYLFKREKRVWGREKGRKILQNRKKNA